MMAKTLCRSLETTKAAAGVSASSQWRLRDVLAVLKAHEIEISSREGLAAIQRQARELFLSLVSALGTTANGMAVDALRTMLAMVHGDTIALLAVHNLVVSLDDLAKIAGVRPRLLSRHLVALRGGDGPGRQIALDGVRALLIGAKEGESLAGQGPATRAVAIPQAASAAKPYTSVQVYGANYALCFNVGSRGAVPGIMLDAAVCGPHGYDWPQAIHVWLSVAEVGELLVVLRRWRESLVLSNHGRSKEKSFEVHKQGDYLFAKVSVRSRDAHSVRGVRLKRSDAQSVAMACIQVLRLAHPELPIDEVLNCLRDGHGVGVQSSALGPAF